MNSWTSRGRKGKGEKRRIEGEKDQWGKGRRGNIIRTQICDSIAPRDVKSRLRREQPGHEENEHARVDVGLVEVNKCGLEVHLLEQQHARSLVYLRKLARVVRVGGLFARGFALPRDTEEVQRVVDEALSQEALDLGLHWDGDESISVQFEKKMREVKGEDAKGERGGRKGDESISVQYQKR